MTLQTQRLSLRELLITDINQIHALHVLAETDEFNTLGIPDTIETTKNIVEGWLSEQDKIPRTSTIFVIEEINTNQFIGLIALIKGKQNYKIAEVWFKLHVNHWRKGYATEALIKVIDLGFNELKLHRIEAGCATGNIASAKVLEKAGMKKEGMKRKLLPIRGKWYDAYHFAILDEDFYGTAL